MRKFKLILTFSLMIIMALHNNTLRANAMVEDHEFSAQDIDYELLSDENFFKLPQMYSNIVSVENIVLTDEELSHCVCAFVTDSNGDLQPLECSATLRKIEIENIATESDLKSELGKNRQSVNNPIIYVLQGTTKVSSGNETSHDVTLNGYLTWIDNAGINNEFVSASGSRSGDYVGDGYYSIVKGTTSLGNGTFSSSFYTTGNSNSHNGWQFKLHIHTNASDSHNVQLTVLNSPLD